MRGKLVGAAGAGEDGGVRDEDGEDDGLNEEEPKGLLSRVRKAAEGLEGAASLGSDNDNDEGGEDDDSRCVTLETDLTSK
jgi:hypothetical protein